MRCNDDRSLYTLIGFVPSPGAVVQPGVLAVNDQVDRCPLSWQPALMTSLSGLGSHKLRLAARSLLAGRLIALCTEIGRKMSPRFICDYFNAHMRITCYGSIDLTVTTFTLMAVHRFEI